MSLLQHLMISTSSLLLAPSPEECGPVRAHTGVWVYNRYLKAVPLRKVLGWTLVAGTASGATQLILVTGAVLSSQHCTTDAGTSGASCTFRINVLKHRLSITLSDCSGGGADRAIGLFDKF